MSRIHVLVIGASLYVGVASASAQTAPDATVIDPDVHQVVLENDHIRVIRAQAGAGRKSPMHSHPPLLLVGIGNARVKFGYPDGKSQIFDIQPGTVVWSEGGDHSWELLAGQVNVVAVEVKSAKAAKAAKAK